MAAVTAVPNVIKLSSPQKMTLAITAGDKPAVLELIAHYSTMSVEFPECRIASNKLPVVSWRGQGLSIRPILWYFEHGCLPKDHLRVSCKTHNCITLAHIYERNNAEANRDALWQKLQREKIVNPLTGCWIRHEDEGKDEKEDRVSCSISGQKYILYRFAYEMHTKQAIAPGLYLRHGHGTMGRCVSPTCFNPLHMLPGSQEENGQDASSDGVHRYRKTKSTVVTPELAKKIKDSKGQGSQLDRAYQFDVTEGIVANIDSGHSWFYIPDKNGKVGKYKAGKRRAAIWTPERYQQLWKHTVAKATRQPAPKIDLMLPFQKECLILGDGTKRQQVKNSNSTRFAHVLSYELHFNNCQPVGSRRLNGPGHNTVIRHLCNVAGCIEPTHLNKGSFQDNGHDLALAGTSKGQRLTATQALEIKKLLPGDSSKDAELAAKYNVKIHVIRGIRRGVNWKWLETFTPPSAVIPTKTVS